MTALASPPALPFLDLAEADRFAADLTRRSGIDLSSQNGEWAAVAATMLAAYLHAAALQSGQRAAAESVLDIAFAWVNMGAPGVLRAIGALRTAGPSADPAAIDSLLTLATADPKFTAVVLDVLNDVANPPR